MIRSILAIPQQKLDQLDCLTLTVYERQSLKNLTEILQPFEQATKLTEGSNIVTASLVLPCVKGLKNQLTNLMEKYKSPLMTALYESFKRWLLLYEEKEDFCMATILDPRFKLN